MCSTVFSLAEQSNDEDLSESTGLDLSTRELNPMMTNVCCQVGCRKSDLSLLCWAPDTLSSQAHKLHSVWVCVCERELVRERRSSGLYVKVGKISCLSAYNWQISTHAHTFGHKTQALCERFNVCFVFNSMSSAYKRVEEPYSLLVMHIFMFYCLINVTALLYLSL